MKTKPTKPVISGYKGFDKNMQCRGFQFEVGKKYKHDGPVKCCPTTFDIQQGMGGFHFCENPFDVFAYYPPSESVFAEVVGSGEVEKHNEDSKVACTNIKIKASISLGDFITAGIKFMFSRKYEETTSNHSDGYSSASSATGYSSASSATGYRSASSATGYSSASSATGYSSASSATGDSSASSATGYSSASSATGYSSASSATGDSSASSATGDRSASSATGYSSASSATGDSSASSATGYSSASSATGYSSASVCTGLKSKAKAGKYGCIALAWWNEDDERGEMRCAETGCGDGTDGKLKAEVWYRLDAAASFVEVED